VGPKAVWMCSRKEECLSLTGIEPGHPVCNRQLYVYSMQIFLAVMNNNKQELTRKARTGHLKWAHLEMFFFSLNVASVNKRNRGRSVR
jgi:hypothetical protein